MTAEEMIRDYKLKYNKQTENYYVIPKKPKFSDIGFICGAIGGLLLGGLIYVFGPRKK